MTYLLDTNILLIFIRDRYGRERIRNEYQLFSPAHTPVISVVSLGEIKSIALRNKWGAKKTDRLVEILDRLVIADINSEDVIEKYAEIEAFSQNKLPHKPLPTTARNMGKNHLWIAATAAVIGAKLLTTDNDFNHLDGEYLDLGVVDLRKT